MGSGKIRRLLERLGAAESGVSMRIPAETRDDLAMLSKNYDTIGLYTEAFYVNSRCRQPYSSGTLKTRPPFHKAENGQALGEEGMPMARRCRALCFVQDCD